MKINISIYRYNSEYNIKPYMQDYVFESQENRDFMLLDVLLKLKEHDVSLSLRKSCREGVCGSDGMNVNGINMLACITPISKIRNWNKGIIIRPLPGLPIIKDLVVNMEVFFKQYIKIDPFLIKKNPVSSKNKEYLQSPEQRKKIDGLYECILCACCSTFCPSFWWNPDKFVGPAGLLNAYRFLSDNRDEAKIERLKKLNDSFSLFRCHNIMNCITVCPKGLNPNKAIHGIKKMLLTHDI